MVERRGIKPPIQASQACVLPVTLPLSISSRPEVGTSRASTSQDAITPIDAVKMEGLTVDSVWQCTAHAGFVYRWSWSPVRWSHRRESNPRDPLGCWFTKPEQSTAMRLWQDGARRWNLTTGSCEGGSLRMSCNSHYAMRAKGVSRLRERVLIMKAAYQHPC